MLKIKRVPTVVSNYQKDEADEGRRAGGCGRNCLNKCCISGTLSVELSWNYVLLVCQDKCIIG